MIVIDRPSDVVNASHSIETESGASPASAPFDAALGFAVIAVLPALFWTTALAGGAWILDISVPIPMLAAVASAITAFLGMVYLSIANRADLT